MTGAKGALVWQVYDLWRTARLNYKYFCVMLRRVQNESKLFEILIAITAPGSALAGLFLWNTPIGRNAWMALLVVAAIFGFLKPWFQHGERIAKYEKLVSGYQTLDHDMARLASSIERDQGYLPAHQDRFREAFERKGVLVQAEAETRIRKRVRRKCQEEVLKELPIDNFYIPPGTSI